MLARAWGALLLPRASGVYFLLLDALSGAGFSLVLLLCVLSACAAPGRSG